ncbi:protease SohB [Endozoicomonas arenosclerae]|uniref:protease SohB n=1 Tax=Endozoicomonas arenosclerae TaxID=1633495 RepID=UPI0007862C6A|nr:protease SohB [Endozoicomonas arenosclerae]
MEYLAEYGLFLAKVVTFVVALLIVIVAAAAMGQKSKKISKGHLEIKKLNEHYQHLKDDLQHAILDKEGLKQLAKDKKKAEKEKKKDKDKKQESKSRLYVLEFDGDMKASAVKSLREEITAVLSVITEKDEVLLKLESAGGMVHAYGLAASQLQRIRDRGVKFTIAVDKVAASGGYMMACTANQIVAAPFAIIGSIGVMAQLPNINKLLKKHDVDIELHTAGEFKRTLTVLGENTDKGRDKFKQDIQDTHQLFKDFIKEERDQVNVEDVATGEIWYGRQAIDKNLIDKVMTSDEYIYSKVDEVDIVQVSYEVKKGLASKLGLAAETTLDNTFGKIWERATQTRYFS